MVRIRLRRVGARNQPSYRIVAADQHKPRDGRFLEILGHYNPRTEPATVEVDEARLFHWLKNGAQASDSVRQLLRTFGTWDRWERYRAGEDLEVLLEEAGANVLEVDPRTRRDDLAGKRPKKTEEAAPAAKEPVKAKAEEAEAPPEEAEAPAKEAEAETEPEKSAEAGEDGEAEVEAAEDEPQAEAEAEATEAEGKAPETAAGEEASEAAKAEPESAAEDTESSAGDEEREVKGPADEETQEAEPSD